ncbi:MAG: Ig-like domain-containing protein [Nanoarchaeota archaeon]|nr:Ig-like domain-containing protein [Nanoarchaeota archaeon]
MPKKALFFVFAFALIILALNFASAANIGYVVKTPSPLNSDEITIKGLLTDNGHSVSILDDITFNASAYDIIIVGEDVTDIKGIFDNKNHKTLFLGSTAAKNAGLSKYGGTTTSNKITISDNNHIITEYFSLGDLTVQDSLETVGYLDGCGAINSQSLAYKTYDYKDVILILRENSLLLDASESCSKRNIPIYERNMFFGLPRASNWNFNAEDLFINSINWLIEGEDSDGDGYYYDEDCNDNDANKWQLLKGYLDNDNDGYGTGALINACSGEELVYGYSDADGDCNDNNKEINPDEDEMQYDGIDQNCDNAAEFSDEIPDVEWNEDGTGVLDLNDYAVDFDDDELEFYVYDTSDEDYISIDSIENGVVNISSEKDWNGEDWIVFLIVDEEGYAISNEIALRVLPVNDASKFTGEIENITFYEDTELTDYLDLNDFFSDVDENALSFSVIGNTFINVILDNGLVSFIPDSDWFGSENIIFSASDGEYNADSNEITLTVDDANEPPEFGEINCLLNINEDAEYNCILNASDFENDELSFSVADENNLECSIDEDELTYTSKLNYNREASCMIEVSDENDYDEYLLEVNVLPVNDAPEIKNYSPSGTPKLMENTNQIFSVSAFDVDGDSLGIRWFLDGVEVANGALYTFNKEKGDYNLTVSVTDNIASEIATKTWNVFAGDISDFTCQEAGGYKIGDNEVCSGSLLATSDSNFLTCCSIPGSPRFSDAGRCGNLSSGLKLKIENPDENDKFMIGDTIKGKIKIENNLDEDLDFDVNAYLYDISADNEIENYEDSVSVDENKNEELEFELIVPEDIDGDNNYAVFVNIID